MKKLLVAIALFMFAGFTFGQTLQEGNFLSIRTMTINLAPDVTMEQYLDFCVNKYAPEFEKSFPGFKVFIIKGIRGDKGNSLGILHYCESEEVRDGFFEGETKTNESIENLQSLIQELEKLGTGDVEWTDWVIQ